MDANRCNFPGHSPRNQVTAHLANRTDGKEEKVGRYQFLTIFLRISERNVDNQCAHTDQDDRTNPNNALKRQIINIRNVGEWRCTEYKCKLDL